MNAARPIGQRIGQSHPALAGRQIRVCVVDQVTEGSRSAVASAGTSSATARDRSTGRAATSPGASPRRFAFGFGSADNALYTWSYKLEPGDDGTDVTESFQLAGELAMRAYWTLVGWARGRTNHKGMRTTLERISA